MALGPLKMTKDLECDRGQKVLFQYKSLKFESTSTKKNKEKRMLSLKAKLTGNKKEIS